MRVTLVARGTDDAIAVDVPAGRQGEDGPTVRRLALDAGVGLAGACGGKGTCGKCRVRISGAASPVTAQEVRHLEPGALAAGIRLACQVTPLGELTVEYDQPGEASILTWGRWKRGRLRPNARSVQVTIPSPAASPSQEGAVRRALGEAGHGACAFSPPALADLPAALRQGGGRVAVTLTGSVVTGVEPAADALPRVLGVAFDVGTTTLAAYLHDLVTGDLLATAASVNPQTAYGADVISRLGAALENPAARQVLAGAVREALSDLATRLARQAGVPARRIHEAVVVGNTAMHHLLLGIHPAGLAYAPYLPAVTAAMDLPAAELGLEIAPGGRVHLLPNIAGYVGADTVGVILATGLDRKRRPAMAVDIGTNGEIVLTDGRRMAACSAAAGPAFEGARISCGMTAAEGAIDRADVVDGILRLHVIGGGRPKGLCGSGLVDLAALLLEHGLLTEQGRLQAPARGAPPDVVRRLAASAQGAEFVLEDGAGGGPRLALTQRDIRELQLAKGAIRAATDVLLRELGVGAGDLSAVYLAGAFGNHLRPASAAAIGLLPAVPHGRIVPVGNAAGTGARMALLSVTERRRAARSAGRVQYVELASAPGFQQTFVERLAFPPSR